MDHGELTLTSPLPLATTRAEPLLAATIVWHPDRSRVGEQYFDATGQGITLNRYAPVFVRGSAAGAPLLYGGISRQPLRICRVGADSVELQRPDCRMTVELDGDEMLAGQRLDAARIADGVLLGLGRAVLLCLHWAHCLPRDNPVPGMLGVSSAAVQTRTLIHTAAAADTPVLLLGETGTGKEVAARAIHLLSRRAGAALVAVNMATLNEALAAAELFGAAKGAYTGAQVSRRGLFAEADGGTLFLDEIGDTPPVIQPMLLRVLENGQYRQVGAAADQHTTARLVAATDRDLDGASFNQPLLRRLEQLVIALPPLRARREDIGLLIVHFLAQAEQAGVVPPFDLVSAFARYHWPGNVRQLMHALGRMALQLRAGDTPVFEALVRASPAPAPQRTDPSAPTPTPRKPGALSEQDILQALDSNGWQIQAAARMLGISRPSLYKLIGLHPGIRKPEHIAVDDLRSAYAACGGAVGLCAARLRTPAEALRRHLRAIGIGRLGE